MTTTNIDPATERATRVFITKVDALFDFAGAILFGGSCGNAP